MNIKEQENQLMMSMILRIVVSVLIWMGLMGYMINRLWGLEKTPTTSTIMVSNVPSIKQENLDILRESIKMASSSAFSLPIARPEPFD